MSKDKVPSRPAAVHSSSTKAAAQAKPRHRHGQPMLRFNICLPQGLVDLIDEAAAQDYTTRSDMIRTAVLWYLRPQGRQLDQADPGAILKTLEHRQALKGLKDMVQDLDIDD